MAKGGKHKLSAKRIALLMAIISLVSFLYKLGLGIISTSMILIVASMSTLIVCICKFLFWHKMNGTREEKREPIS